MTSTSPFSLDGHVAVITGGATGLGLGITRAMVAAGARAVVVGSRAAAQASSSLAEFGDRARYYQHDLSHVDQATALIERIIADHGRIDALVNNAGNHVRKPIEDMSITDYTNVLNLHLVAAFALSKAVVPHMKANHAGSLVFQASMTSFIGQPDVTGYATAKAGYLGLVRTLAAECGPAGVRANAIAPGWIDTPMYRQATDDDPARRAKIIGRIPMDRVGVPDDIGNAAVFLCSDAARYVNGVCLPVDGGALIGF